MYHIHNYSLSYLPVNFSQSNHYLISMGLWYIPISFIESILFSPLGTHLISFSKYPWALKWTLVIFVKLQNISVGLLMDTAVIAQDSSLRMDYFSCKNIFYLHGLISYFNLHFKCCRKVCFFNRVHILHICFTYKWELFNQILMSFTIYYLLYLLK